MQQHHNTPADQPGRPEKYFRKPEVKRVFYPVSDSTLYKAMAEGNFPRPVRIGAKAVAWRESDILRWQAQREQLGGQS